MISTSRKFQRVQLLAAGCALAKLGWTHALRATGPYDAWKAANLTAAELLESEPGVELLGQEAARFDFVVHARVLMDNHYHLLLRTGQANTSGAIISRRLEEKVEMQFE